MNLFSKDVRHPIQVRANTYINSEAHDCVQAHPATQHELSVPPSSQDA